jgi:hypothetical protein
MRPPSHPLRTLGSFYVSLTAIWLATASYSDGADNWRRYSNGPLTEADFRSRPPAFRKLEAGRVAPITAYTYTEIKYDSQFQVTLARGRWTARLTSAEAYAIVRWDQSWNIRPNDERLMDHEQGHFDLSHSYALAIQLHLDERRKAGKLPMGRGETSDAAIRDLEDRLRSELKPIFDEHVKVQQDYDRITDHGGLSEAQIEQRRQQAAKIAELTEKLDKNMKKKRKS